MEDSDAVHIEEEDEGILREAREIDLRQRLDDCCVRMKKLYCQCFNHLLEASASICPV